MSGKLLAAIDAELQRIDDDYKSIKHNLKAGSYADVVALGRALNKAAKRASHSRVAEKLQDDWRAKGGK
jgi:hypothetical protein